MDLSLYMTAHMRKLGKGDGHSETENRVETEIGGKKKIVQSERNSYAQNYHIHLFLVVFMVMHLPKKCNLVNSDE